MVRFTFWLHFALGAFFGLFLGFGIWGEPRLGLYTSARAGWICMIGVPILSGLAFGFAKVKFNWDNLSKRGKNW